jgi:hypothetical protein
MSTEIKSKTPSCRLMNRRLFVFRNRNNFLKAGRRINEKLLTTEGEEWIRMTARAAAVPDTLPGQWTSAASPMAWHLSA